MRRSLGLVAVGVAVLGLTGCGDNFKLVLRDYVTLWNEYHDCASKIPLNTETADEAAEELAKVQLKTFKKRMEYLNKRVQVLGANADADTIRELKAAVSYWKEELDETAYTIDTKDGVSKKKTGKRSEREMKRLSGIIDSIAKKEADRHNDPPRKRGKVFQRAGQKDDDFKAMIKREVDELEQLGITLVPVIWETVAPNVYAVLMGYDELAKTSMGS